MEETSEEESEDADDVDTEEERRSLVLVLIWPKTNMANSNRSMGM